MRETKAKSATEVVDFISLPDGNYPGSWGGYGVEFEVNNRKIHLSVENGVRTIAMPCMVHIRNGEITVTAGANGNSI